MNFSSRLLLSSVVLFAATGTVRGQEVPFLYHRAGGDQAAGLQVEAETAYGTREARPFGERGLEQGVRVSTRFSRWVELEAWGALLWVDGDREAAGASAEVRSHLLTEKANGVGLSVGAGMVRDFRGDTIARTRLTLSRRAGNLELVGTALAEVPFAEDRDAVDVIFGVGGAYEVSSRLNIGGEVLGEDLEGFWEEEEAEGGARLVAGPTVDVAFLDRLTFKANAGLVYAMTGDAVASSDASRTGFLGRMAVGWCW